VTPASTPEVPGSIPPRPPYRDVRFVALVFFGGCVGTAIRAWLEATWPAPAGQWPWTTFLINLSGSFILGFLYAALAATGPDRGWRKATRVGVGTGVLGGYTTYSSFAVETVALAASAHTFRALAYALGSVVLGIGCASVGALLARRCSDRAYADTGEAH